MKKTKQAHLDEVLETHRMKHIDDLVKKYKDKKQELKEELESQYSTKMYSPLQSGSFAKHTAINIKFDLDTVAPFKRNSFDTLEVMFDDVYDFLLKKYDSEAMVRKQKVSIGVDFYRDSEGDTIKLDVVPGRELNQDQYCEDNKLNLYVNSKYGVIEEKTHLLTNIQSQIDHIKARESERKIIRLLKVWKISNRESYKSFLLELLVIKAFDKVDVSGNLWEKLKSVLSYIRDNITKDGFTLKDPGNSGNNVIDTLESYERENLSNKMGNIISNIERNEDNIKTYFPINKDFEESDSDKGYAVKSASVISIPPNNTRFG